LLLLILILILWKFFQADDIQNETNELLRIRDYIFTELANNTGQPVEKVSSLYNGIHGDRLEPITYAVVLYVIWLYDCSTK